MRLVWQVSGAVARQLGVRAYPTIMWLQLMDEGVTIAEHTGGRDAESLIAFAKAAPGMIEEGLAAQKAKEGTAEGTAEGGAAAEPKPEAEAENLRRLDAFEHVNHFGARLEPAR